MTDKPEASWNQILMASYSESGQGEKAAQLAQTAAGQQPERSERTEQRRCGADAGAEVSRGDPLLEKARAAGCFQATRSDYINLAKLYLITGQEATDPEAQRRQGRPGA